MTKNTTITDRPGNGSQRGSDALRRRRGAWSAVLRSVLQGTRLFDRAVRSLSRKLVDASRQLGFKVLSFLLDLCRPMMLAGIRCAGAGGGGPGI